MRPSRSFSPSLCRNPWPERSAAVYATPAAGRTTASPQFGERVAEVPGIEAHTTTGLSLSAARDVPDLGAHLDASDHALRGCDLRVDRTRRALEEHEDAARMQNVQRARL